jgi:hypothetical protein
MPAWKQRPDLAALAICPRRHTRARGLRPCLLCIVSFVALGPMGAQGTEAPHATLTAREVRAALATNQEKIKSIYVEYTSSDYQGDVVPKGTYLRRVVALKAPDAMLHLTAHGNPKLDWREDPFQQRARIRNGHLRNEFPLDRVFIEADVDLKKDGLPGTLPREFLFNATGLWPLTGVKPLEPTEEPYVLPKVALCPKYVTVATSAGWR